MAESAARDERAMETLDKIDEVVGYVEDNGVEYYYGRREGGMIRRWESRLFQDKHRHLIDEYERKKEAGELDWFDPSSSTQIHPKSRMRLSIHLRPTPSAKSDAGDTEAAYSEAHDELEDSADEEDAADDEEYGEDEEDGAGTRARRSTRTAANKPRELPFSPRKTRSQKIYTIDDSDSDSEGGGSAPPTRRSTRAKKAIKLNLDTDYADSDAEDSDEYTTSNKRAKASKPRVRRAKAARPAYGFIRPITDIDLDPSSDEEMIQLRQHRR
ncbi:hypothetical protein HDZ31DRAFT_69192, partial [Schizophyllum fasciatum]